MTNRFSRLVGLLLVIACSASASEKAFFGHWCPPDSLVPFWTPLDESWWNPADNTRIIEYARQYAKRSDPKTLLAEIVRDLKASPSVVRTFVYSMLVMHWDQEITLPLLMEYYKSNDPDARVIAADFIADIEEKEALEAGTE